MSVMRVPNGLSPSASPLLSLTDAVEKVFLHRLTQILRAVGDRLNVPERSVAPIDTLGRPTCHRALPGSNAPAGSSRMRKCRHDGRLPTRHRNWQMIATARISGREIRSVSHAANMGERRPLLTLVLLPIDISHSCNVDMACRPSLRAHYVAHRCTDATVAASPRRRKARRACRAIESMVT